MKIHVTNPTTGKDYGVWELKEMIKALSDPLHYKDMAYACCMLYDLAADELTFSTDEIIEKSVTETIETINRFVVEWHDSSHEEMEKDIADLKTKLKNES